MFRDFSLGKNVFGNPCRSHFYNGGYPWIGIHSCCLCPGSPSPSQDYVTFGSVLCSWSSQRFYKHTMKALKLWILVMISVGTSPCLRFVENDNKASLVHAGDHLAPRKCHTGNPLWLPIFDHFGYNPSDIIDLCYENIFALLCLCCILFPSCIRTPMKT